MAVQRDGFNSRLGFILATAGSAVGLGNIWGFPFRASEGGGAAFVVMYLLFCFILCFPVMVAEIAIGRKTNTGPAGAFKALGFANWNIVGYLGITCGVFVLAFYNVIAAWAFGYFIELLQGNFAIGSQISEFTKDWVTVSLYCLLFMTATAYVVSNGISSGIEKAAKIMMPSLLIMILVIIAYALTLPNAMKGLEFYLVPDFDKLTGPVIYSALGQAFFSLSLGMGALITFGSYLGKTDNIITSAAWIALFDIAIAILAGFMIFPLVFSQGIETSGGMGLIFETLPGAFANLGPVLGVIVGAGFFLLLSFAAFTSTISLLEVPTTFLVDQKKLPRKQTTWAVALFILLLGIPSILSKGTVDWLTHFITLPGPGSLNFMFFTATIAMDTFLPLGGFLITVFTAYRWKKSNFNDELSIGNNSTFGKILQKYVHFAVSYICPPILGSMFIVTIAEVFFGVELLHGLF